MSASESIALTLGQTLTLERSGNPTTGYVWTILLSPGLELVEETYHPSSQAVGAGGVQTWTVRATNHGYQYILLWNHRPWLAPVISSKDLISVEVMESVPAPPSLPSDKKEFEVYFDRNMRVVGFAFENIDYTPDGYRTPKVKAYRSMSFDVKGNLDHLLGMKFYEYNDDIFYSVEDDSQMTDRMVCIYDRRARMVGCPTGGLSGRGDGSIPNWREYKFLGTIKVQARSIGSASKK